jgi:hypothetical protein
MVVDNPFDAIFENRRSKVYRETKGQFEEPEISQHLFPVGGRKVLNGFNLNQDFSFNQQIGPEAFIKSQPLEDYWN